MTRSRFETYTDLPGKFDGILAIEGGYIKPASALFHLNCMWSMLEDHMRPDEFAALRRAVHEATENTDVGTPVGINTPERRISEPTS